MAGPPVPPYFEQEALPAPDQWMNKLGQVSSHPLVRQEGELLGAESQLKIKGSALEAADTERSSSVFKAQSTDGIPCRRI